MPVPEKMENPRINKSRRLAQLFFEVINFMIDTGKPLLVVFYLKHRENLAGVG